MKQVLTGQGGVLVKDVPAPGVEEGRLLVRVGFSCISVGTEMAGVRSAAEPLYRRALRQPAKVRKALQMFMEKGFRETAGRIAGAGADIPLGYSAAGTVLAMGTDVTGFAPGQPVACAGAGFANHAEIISVPVNLAAPVPAGVDLEAASSVALGAIALQGVRRAAPALGDSVLVIGLGILGQLTVQLLHSAGCRVIGSDPQRARTDVALGAGLDHAIDPAAGPMPEAVRTLTAGFGADAVIVTAGGTDAGLLNEAVRACRPKGRVVLVGDVPIHLDRSELYAREVDFLISTSYGPGRYDAAYEIAGSDYPLPYVRWTENRNMSAYLDLLATRRVKLDAIPRETHGIDQARDAYARILSGQSPALLHFLGYPEREDGAGRRIALAATARPVEGAIRVGLIGAGAFATGMHLPNLARLGGRYSLQSVMARNGATARAVAERYGAKHACSDAAEVLGDPDVDLVIVSTRHHLHAPLVLQALAAGKHVFVEKPLALDRAGLAAIARFFEGTASSPVLMTGFNRRFSPAVQRMKELLSARTSPAVINYRVNAGYLPASHWVHGEEGGGRNIGEACHFYDVFAYLIGSNPDSVQASAARPASRQWQMNDNFVATLTYPDGSVCTLTYTALGHASHPKEQMDVYFDGKVAFLDDYRSLVVRGVQGRDWRAGAPEKGHLQEFEALADALAEGRWPIPLEDQIGVTDTSFTVEDRIRMTASPDAERPAS